jgi:hypothetical protein
MLALSTTAVAKKSQDPNDKPKEIFANHKQ